MPIAPDLADVLLMAFKAAQERQVGPLPAKVESYSVDTQVCDATPLVRVPVAGELVQPPTCRDVPVLWPSGAGWYVHAPLARGDTVWLLPAGADISQWHTQGVSGSTEVQHRRLSLADVVAIPGSVPLTAPLSPPGDNAYVISAPEVRLGDGAASESVAIASKVLAELQNLVTWLNTHTHPTPSGPSSPPTTPASSPGSVAAQRVKVV